MSLTGRLSSQATRQQCCDGGRETTGNLNDKRNEREWIEAEFFALFSHRNTRLASKHHTNKRVWIELKQNRFLQNIFFLSFSKEKKENIQIEHLLIIADVGTTAPTLWPFQIPHQHSRRPFSLSFPRRRKKCPFGDAKENSAPPDEVTTDRRHNGWDWEKCPIKNLCATSAPWTVQCIYQCHRSSKATDISEAWCETWPLTCTGCRQTWEGADSQTKPEFLLRAQRSALQENARGILHFARMQKRMGTKFHLFCTKKLIYNCLI